MTHSDGYRSSCERLIHVKTDGFVYGEEGEVLTMLKLYQAFLL